MFYAVLASLVLSHSAQADTYFPKGFKWCVATAAHQIEGGNINSDWADWEAIPGKIKNGERSGAACDHWNRLEEDTQILSDMNVNQYRFSVEWAKLEPREGEWDWEAVRHYQHEIALLESRGIAPMITLQHFTLPRWFAAKGGWEYDQAPALFARYAGFVLTHIGPNVREWITLNEPMALVVNGYLAGIYPPGIKGTMETLLPPMIGLLRSHAAAYHMMKALASAPGHAKIRIGIAHHLRIFDAPNGFHPLDKYLAGKFDHAFNWAFANALETGRLKLYVPFAVKVNKTFEGMAGTQDFIGVNYYSRDIVHLEFGGMGFRLTVEPDAETTDLGWEIYPQGFYRILKAVAKHYPGKSIFITENGLADAKDTNRTRFLETHVMAMATAIREGVPVEGYCHWSLLDNFEWQEGFTPRFGLYEVDYVTQARRPRPSALRFAEMARRNGF